MSRALGRNDPCPCGSGLKFKNCHLGREQPAAGHPQGETVVDAAELRIAFLLRENVGLVEDAEEFVHSIEREYFGPYEDAATLVPEQAIPVLLSWLTRLASEISLLARTNSKYFWHFLFQRLAPSKGLPQSYRTIALHWQILKLATIKYGRDRGTRFVFVPSDFDPLPWAFDASAQPLPPLYPVQGSTLLPAQITVDDLQTALIIERLVYSYWACTSMLRRVWKGGVAKVRDGRIEDVLHDKETEEMIELYDQRTDRSPLLSHFGSSVSLELAGESESPLLCLVPGVNAEQLAIPVDWLSPSATDGQSYEPNYLIAPASLNPILGKIAELEPHLSDKLRFDPRELLAFLNAFSVREIYLWREIPQRRLQLEKCGYLTIRSEDWFVEELIPFFVPAAERLGLAFDTGSAGIAIRRLFARYRYAPDALARIDLWDRSGARLFIPSPSGDVFDLTAIPLVLAGLFEPLASFRGEVGNLKGAGFEDEVARAIEERVPGARILCRRKKVKRADDHTDVGDIDVGVVIGKTFFVLECKARSLHPAFDRGEPAAIEWRTAANLQALKQNDDLAGILASGDPPTDFEIPPKLSRVASAVVSPFPEFIPQKDDMWFLDEVTPRVCTPTEIADFLAKFEDGEHAEKTWLVHRLPLERSPNDPT